MIYHYDSVPAFLNSELRRRVQANPRYSMRAFAQNLQLSPGALSEILSGRRDLSIRHVPKLIRGLGLSQAEAKHLLTMAQIAKTGGDGALRSALEKTRRSTSAIALEEEVFDFISGWQHFAILNLLDCDDCVWSSKWIAARLGLSQSQAIAAMELLLKMGLVVKRNGKYVGSGEHVCTGRDVPSAAVRGYHRQILEKAMAALETQTVAERDFAGVGFAFDPSRLPEIKAEISEFLDQLLAKYGGGGGRKTEVYFIETILFKLTQGTSK